MEIKEIAPSNESLVIKGGSNLIGATVSESIENVINVVSVYDTNNKLVQDFTDFESLSEYGRLGKIIKQSKDNNKFSEAESLLKENILTQKITIDSLGDVRNRTGGTVIVEEPHTGLKGLFYIENDVHEWKKGLYFNKLIVNFKAIMNESQGGTEKNKR